MKIGGLVKHSFCDYPGKIAAVVFTQGCNFNCPFCHNQDLIRFNDFTSNFSEAFIFNFLDLRRNQLDGVVISGGEPLIQTKIIPFIKAIKSMGFYVKLDTNGSAPTVLNDLLSKKLIDYVAMDIKAPFSKYDLLSGVKVNIEHIKESITLISSYGINHHFRTTKYPKLLNKKNMEEIKEVVPLKSNYIEQTYVKK